MPLITFVLIMVSIFLFCFWVKQFSNLMSMSSEQFVSKDDKLIWAITLIFLGAFGACLFFFITRARLEWSDSLGKRFDIEDHHYKDSRDSHPEYREFIDKACGLASHKRLNLENFYQKMDDEGLRVKFNYEKGDISDEAFGVLTVVMNLRDILPK